MDWPKRMSLKKRLCTVPTTTPDRDNLLKCVMDALNKIIWRDDALVFSGRTEKRYGDPPRGLRRPSLPLARYAGTYRDAWYGDIDIADEGGKLTIRFSKTPLLVGDLEHYQYGGGSTG